MKFIHVAILVLLFLGAFIFAGCGDGLSTSQKNELKTSVNNMQEQMAKARDSRQACEAIQDDQAYLKCLRVSLMQTADAISTTSSLLQEQSKTVKGTCQQRMFALSANIQQLKIAYEMLAVAETEAEWQEKTKLITSVVQTIGPSGDAVNEACY